MSFWSSIFFYRPGPPPLISIDEIGRFARALGESGALGQRKESSTSLWHRAKVKCGRRIDEDDADTQTYEPVPEAPTVFSVGEIEWDINIEARTASDLGGRLVGDHRHVYRATLLLDGFRDDISERLQWCTKIGQEECRASFGSISLLIEPAIYCNQDTGDEQFLGWVRLSLEGPGYFYPWKPSECIERARSIPEVAAMEELCRRYWPVEATSPDARVRAARQSMKARGTWPHESVDHPLDWCWGANGFGA